MPIDTWSLVTGLASVVSLIIAIPDRFAAWRKWVIPIGWICMGAALGRITSSLGPSAEAAFSDHALIGVLGIISVCLLGLYFIIRTIRESLNVEGGFFIILIVGTMWGISSLVTKYLDGVKPQVKVPELVEFSALKESRGEIATAIQYLTIAKTASDDPAERDRLNKKIVELQEKLLASGSRAATTSPKD